MMLSVRAMECVKVVSANATMKTKMHGLVRNVRL